MHGAMKLSPRLRGHAERSEASHPSNGEMLRCAQHDQQLRLMSHLARSCIILRSTGRGRNARSRQDRHRLAAPLKWCTLSRRMAMKAVILAGGLGTRISEETQVKPKPMIEIGGKPILWHIMKVYAEHGVRDFIVCLGYKGYVVKEYFANYFLHMSDVTIDLASNKVDVHQQGAEPWKVTLVDT